MAGFRELRGPGGEWKIGADHGAAFVSAVGLGLGAGEVVRAESALDRAGVPLVALRTTPCALIIRVPEKFKQLAPQDYRAGAATDRLVEKAAG